MKLQIDINQHSVSIEGHTVFRPSGISVMQWLDTWESMKGAMPDADSQNEILDLQDIIADLRQQIEEQEKELRILRKEKFEWAMDIKA